MTTRQLDGIGKDQIVANKRCITCAQSCREGLVVRVAQSDYATTIRFGAIRMIHRKQTKIVVVIASERMNLVLNGETILIQETLGALNQFMVRDGLMGDGNFTCLLVGFVPVRYRRRGNSLDKLIVYESAIASADVKVDGFARSDSSVLLILHSSNNS